MRILIRKEIPAILSAGFGNLIIPLLILIGNSEGSFWLYPIKLFYRLAINSHHSKEISAPVFSSRVSVCISLPCQVCPYKTRYSMDTYLYIIMIVQK